MFKILCFFIFLISIVSAKNIVKKSYGNATIDIVVKFDKTYSFNVKWVGSLNHTFELGSCDFQLQNVQTFTIGYPQPVNTGSLDLTESFVNNCNFQTNVQNAYFTISGPLGFYEYDVTNQNILTNKQKLFAFTLVVSFAINPVHPNDPSNAPNINIIEYNQNPALSGPPSKITYCNDMIPILSDLPEGDSRLTVMAGSTICFVQHVESADYPNLQVQGLIIQFNSTNIGSTILNITDAISNTMDFQYWITFGPNSCPNCTYSSIVMLEPIDPSKPMQSLTLDVQPIFANIPLNIVANPSNLPNDNGSNNNVAYGILYGSVCFVIIQMLICCGIYIVYAYRNNKACFKKKHQPLYTSEFSSSSSYENHTGHEDI